MSQHCTLTSAAWRNHTGTEGEFDYRLSGNRLETVCSLCLLSEVEGVWRQSVNGSRKLVSSRTCYHQSFPSGAKMTVLSPAQRHFYTNGRSQSLQSILSSRILGIPTWALLPKWPQKNNLLMLWLPYLLSGDDTTTCLTVDDTNLFT